MYMIGLFVLTAVGPKCAAQWLAPVSLQCSCRFRSPLPHLSRSCSRRVRYASSTTAVSHALWGGSSFNNNIVNYQLIFALFAQFKFRQNFLQTRGDSYRATTCLENREFYSSRDLSQNRGTVGGGNFVRENCPKAFQKNCINRLFSIIHLVHYTDYFVLFIAEFCLLCSSYCIYTVPQKTSHFVTV